MDSDNKEFVMVEAIPGKSRMGPALNKFGYVFVKVIEDNIWAPKGFEIRAHEYHYSEMAVDDGARARGIKTCFEVSKRKEGMIIKSWNCGFKTSNPLAGYPHLHFWANPEFARGFIKSCLDYSGRQGGQS
ncbi:MAG: hypothetical protein K6U80_15390 [Firmicutes bacterium]|nr:hypothetical protein [Bacillota bacterium]